MPPQELCEAAGVQRSPRIGPSLTEEGADEPREIPEERAASLRCVDIGALSIPISAEGIPPLTSLPAYADWSRSVRSVIE